MPDCRLLFSLPIFVVVLTLLWTLLMLEPGSFSFCVKNIIHFKNNVIVGALGKILCTYFESSLQVLHTISFAMLH